MSKRDKLLAKARRTPNGLRFSELETLLNHCGWTLRRQSGSHRIWYSPQQFRLPVQEGKGGKAKGYQLGQLLEQLDKEDTND